jgi:DNA primase
MATWIDFKQLRKSLSFEAVLRHYGVEPKIKGSQHHGFCPLPNHKGKKNSPSFSANLEKGIFQCFGCGAKGNLLEFAALMEGVDPSNGTELRNVAVMLQGRFCPAAGNDKREPAPEKPSDAKAAEHLPLVVNAPLDFELKGLDQAHPYLRSRGFTPETIAHFGLGFTCRGSLKGRIAIPLHDQGAKLVGYAGRVTDDATIGEDNPRYRFPGKRERGGVLHEFRKTLFLYNGFRFVAPLDDLIVVEGFPSVWWLTQNGLPQVVATMGSDCSDRQVELVIALVKPTGRIWFMPDGDEAGMRFAQSFLVKVSPHRFVQWAKLAAEQQPTDYDGPHLKVLCRIGGQ